MVMTPPQERPPGEHARPGHSPGTRLFELLAEVGREFGVIYPGWTFELVGHQAGYRSIRLPCPKPPPNVEEDSLAGNILTALDEADERSTIRELSFAATGGAPTGAVKRAVRKLVEAGVVKEHPTTPRTYERVR